MIKNTLDFKRELVRERRLRGTWRVRRWLVASGVLTGGWREFDERNLRPELTSSKNVTRKRYYSQISKKNMWKFLEKYDKNFYQKII